MVFAGALIGIFGFFVGLLVGLMSRVFGITVNEQTATMQRQEAEAEYYMLKRQGICMECRRRESDD